MGYTISETPTEIINYGIARVRPMKKDKYIKRLHRFIHSYRPTIIILRDYKDSGKRISKRVMQTIDAFEKEAEQLSLEVYRYSRKEIKQVFDEFGCNSKYGISKTISTWYPELQHRMPNLRKYPNAEHYQMGVFDAFALMLTHHYLK